MSNQMFFVPEHCSERRPRVVELHMNAATVDDVNLFIGTLTRPHVGMGAARGSIIGAVQVQFGEGGPIRVIGNVTYAPGEPCRIPTGALTVKFGLSKDRQHTASESGGRLALLGPWIAEKPDEVRVLYMIERAQDPLGMAVPFEFPAEQLAFLRKLSQGRGREVLRDVVIEEFGGNPTHLHRYLADSNRVDESAEPGPNLAEIPADADHRSPAPVRGAKSPRSMVKTYRQRTAEGKRHGPSAPSTPDHPARGHDGSRCSTRASPPIAQPGPESKRSKSVNETGERPAESPFRLRAVGFTDSGPIAESPILSLSDRSLDLSVEYLDAVDRVRGLGTTAVPSSANPGNATATGLKEYTAIVALQASDEAEHRLTLHASDQNQLEPAISGVVGALTAGSYTGNTARASTGGAVPAADRPSMTRVLGDGEAGDLLYPAGLPMQRHQESVRDRLRGNPERRRQEESAATELEKQFVKKAGFRTVYAVHRRFAHAPGLCMGPFMIDYELSRERDLPWTTSCQPCEDIPTPVPIDDTGYPIPSRPGQIINLVIMGQAINGPGFAFFSDELTSFLLMFPVQTSAQLCRAVATAFRYFALASGTSKETRYLRAPAVLKGNGNYTRFLSALGARDADELLAEDRREQLAGCPIIRIPDWGALRLSDYLEYRARCVFGDTPRPPADLTCELRAITHSHNNFPFGDRASAQVQLHTVVDDRWPFVPHEPVVAFVKGRWIAAKFVEFGRDEFDYVVVAGGHLHHTQALSSCDAEKTSTPQ